MNLREKKDATIQAARALHEGGFGAAGVAIDDLRQFANAGMHVGDPAESFDEEKTWEWVAGQLIHVIEGGHLFSVNSVINLVFAYERDGIDCPKED